MINVAVMCAGANLSSPTPCEPPHGFGQHTDLVDEHDVPAWVAAKVAELGYVTVDGHHYCQRHNPGDSATRVDLNDRTYTPLGASGWEARILDGGPAGARVEVRMTKAEPAVSAELAAQIHEGITEAERGGTIDRGSFARYLRGEGDDA